MKPTGNCYHCGLVNPSQTQYCVKIDGVLQAMCCPGCQAVAQAIVDDHLENYYRFRDTSSFSQQHIIPPQLQELRLFDNPTLQEQFLMPEEEGINHRTMLTIEGITCAACVWLLEKCISQIPGVVNFSVNLVTHRAQIIWNNLQIPLSDILYQITKIGYQARPFHIEQHEASRKSEQNSALKRLAISGIGFGQVMMFAAPLYGWFAQDISNEYRDFFRVVSLVVTTPILVYCGLPFFKSAWRSLRIGFFNMDVSISIALLVVYVAGIYATVARTGEVYFDSITMFLFFITLSRYLEMRARNYSSFIVQKLNQLQPLWILKLNGGIATAVPIKNIAVNDVIIIKAGETIPIDGIILEGVSSVNEALLTGESIPKLKQKNSNVVAGAQNIDNPLTIRVTQVGNKTTLATIVQLYERAEQDKPKIVSIANKFSHYFVMGLLFISFVAFVYWWPYSPSKAFWVMISILVISCPCALALATPVALTASMSALTKIGFLCTRGHVIDGLNKTTDIIFDKTGTLTEGVYSLKSIKLLGDCSEATVLSIAAAIEAQSEHPIASAFKKFPTLYKAENVVIHANQGLEADIAEQHYRLGKPAFILRHLPQHVNLLVNDLEGTKIVLANDFQLLALFVLEDRLRAHALATIAGLQQKKYRIHLLSGDNKNIVTYYANKLGISHFQANMSPRDKLDYVKNLQDKQAIVTMVGDGINDAPVLMQAHISIAMSNAADLTRVSADAVLLHGDLSILLQVLRHVKKTQWIIKENLSWAVIYNLVSLPLAVSGLVAPYVAAGLMSMSSLLVVGNALRLVWLTRLKKEI